MPLLSSWSIPSFAQSPEKEPPAVLEIGGATDRSLTESQSSFGPTVAVEFTPIENWLELEAGITPLFRRHSTEWSVDLLFKKPWTLSDTKEVMFGIGPEWIHSNSYGARMNSVGGEMFLTLCLGPRKNIGSAGISNPATNTSSGRGTNTRWA
jgi:hypothetical protein